MAVYRVGKFINLRRNELKLSMTELSDGLCSQTTLSRIESGDQSPKSDTLLAIMQRLGFSDDSVELLLSDDDMNAMQTLRQARRLYNRGEYEKAVTLIESVEDRKNLSELKQQQCDMIVTMSLFRSKQITAAQALNLMEKTLRLTCRQYSVKNLPKVMTFCEINILNTVSNLYHETGDNETSIRILYHLKRYHESGILDDELFGKTYTMILSNISCALLDFRRYDECIEICDKGIEAERKSNNIRYMPQYMFNKGIAMVRKNLPSDREAARQTLLDAYDLYRIIGNRPKAAENLREFIIENYGLIV